MTIDFTSFTNTINGSQKTTSKTRTGINPANKQPLYPVPVSTQQDVDDAVAAARAAYPKWRDTEYSLRQKALRDWADALEKHTDEFVKLLTTEQGKPTFMATMEINSAIKSIRDHSKYPMPEDVMEETEDKKIIVRYFPLGVAVGIVPWNFPFALAINKIFSAVLTGNAIIIKPSPFTPYCGLKLVEVAQQFFPPGVIQCLSGEDDLGPKFTNHPGVDKISFTGSTATGRRIMEACSKTLKRVTLELGGNDAAIVLKDADIAQAAPSIAQYSFLNSGQICIALKRIYVHSSIYDKFRDAMVATAANLKYGPGTQPDVFLGPVQNKMQYDRVKTFFDDIKTNNQKVLVGGQFLDNSEGYFVQPTIIDNPPDDSRLVKEEPFGPIVPILKYETEEEAIQRANSSEYGLGASVWGTDLKNAEKVARQLEAGNVWINEHMSLTNAAPFGGFKASGLGVEGGPQGLLAYCNSQTLHLRKGKL